MWVQLEFQFDFRKTKKKVDYDLLVEELRKGPLTFTQIQAIAGIKRADVAQTITTLSLHYPIYEVRRGLYKLSTAEDYGDGINHKAAALKGLYDENC